MHGLKHARCHYSTQPANAPAVYLSETIPRNFASDAPICRRFLSTLTGEKRLGGSVWKERCQRWKFLNPKRIWISRVPSITTMILSVNLDVWWNEGEESGGWEPLWPHAHSSVAPIKRATLISTTRSDPAVISFSRAPAVYSALSLSPFSPLLVPPLPSAVPARFHSRSSARTRTHTRAPRDLPRHVHRPRIFVFVNKWTLIVQCDIVA